MTLASQPPRVSAQGLKKGLSLRQKVLAFVSALIILSLAASTVTLYRITEVSRQLDGINRVSVPLGRLFVQMQSDSDLLRRELERSLGSQHWSDPHWRPRPVPRWIIEVLENEISRLTELVNSDLEWSARDVRPRWRDWVASLQASFRTLQEDATRLQAALESRNSAAASTATAAASEDLQRLHGRVVADLEAWRRQVWGGAAEYEGLFRQGFADAEQQMISLRSGLEGMLGVVVLLSLLLLWLGERALRPMAELTRLAHDIADRGLRKGDKGLVPEMPLSRNDEVSQLAREFHRMATTLLEREKTVETQQKRLMDQNAELRKMGELQEKLRHAESLAAIGRMSAQVAHEIRNPLHSIGLEAELALDVATKQGAAPALKQSLQSVLAGVDRLEKITENYLKLSRPSPAARQVVDLGEVLENVLATYAQQCEARGVRVNWARENGADLRVEGDAQILEQALGNLLRNALQALEGTPSPRVEWSIGKLESGRVYVRIRDNGPGVSDGVRERLFTPFVTTKAQGTGLGLAFVKKAVEDLGGAVHALPPAEPGASPDSRGATFELSIPGVPS